VLLLTIDFLLLTPFKPLLLQQSHLNLKNNYYHNTSPWSPVLSRDFFPYKITKIVEMG